MCHSNLKVAVNRVFRNKIRYTLAQSVPFSKGAVRISHLSLILWEYNWKWNVRNGLYGYYMMYFRRCSRYSTNLRAHNN